MKKNLVKSLRKHLSSRIGVLLLSVLAGTGLSATAQVSAPLTPAQAAYIKVESQKAEDRFVKRIAEISGARQSTVRRALPAQGRITDPVIRSIAALERSLEQPLSEEQKAQIMAADVDYRKELQQVQVDALKR